MVGNRSTAEEKVALFRGLFRGRTDVYARRFESRKTGKSGYSPACGNEWVRGVCEKPKIKCSDCAHRLLLPLNDEIIRWHLSGQDSAGREFVAGVYPMLADEPVFSWLRTSIKRAGKTMQRHSWIHSGPWTCRRRWSVHARETVPMSGYFSRSRFPRPWLADWERISSPRRWSVAPIWGSIRMIACFPTKTPCRRVDSETLLLSRCKSARVNKVTVYFSTTVSHHIRTNGYSYRACAKSAESKLNGVFRRDKQVAAC